MLNDHLSDLSDVLDEWRESQNAVKEGRTPQPLYLEQVRRASYVYMCVNFIRVVRVGWGGRVVSNVQ